jgi:hypothetical protein
MLKVGSSNVRFCDGVTRRDFLRVGGLGALGLSLADYLALQQAGAAATNGKKNCILLFLVGGPSQLDTWDPKPDAPAEVRGPFRPIRTNVSGIEICKHFPLMARMADKYTLIRSVHHQEAPIHETGHQLMQTGRLFRGGVEHPHYGSVLAKLRGIDRAVPPYVVLPSPIGNTGVSVPHGQEAGYLGSEYDPFYVQAEANGTSFTSLDPARLNSRGELVSAVDRAQRQYERGQADEVDRASRHAFTRIFSRETKQAFAIDREQRALRDRYGRNTFGQSCLLARRLVESGVGLVTVNMFDTVFNNVTWDCHANGGSLAVTLDDYKRTLCPMFDRAYTTLLSDLNQRGLLDDTLVVAMGEFGRTYKLNSRGGRDHWPQVWTILFAGGGVPGGRVVGSSDKNGAEPKDNPVHPSQIAASIYQALGVDLDLELPGPNGKLTKLIGAEPVRELLLA